MNPLLLKVMASSSLSYYHLSLFIDVSDYSGPLSVDQDKHELLNLYQERVETHNQKAFSDKYFDAGFDLLVPEEITCPPERLTKVDHAVKCAMSFVPFGDLTKASPVGYYLYCRSSTATKTTLRLANAVGIIDSGYRGNIIAAFDNIASQPYTVERHQRLVQLCPPNLSYPLKVTIVNDLSELGELTERGTGGFGSTGL